jgi:drug/metabolite transporter (DMT)-like permease
MKKALLQLHAAVFLAGFTGVLGRLISLNELFLVWYRLLFAIIVLWLIKLIFIKSEIKFGKKNIVKLFFTGSLVALHWVFFYGSIKYSNVSVGLVCFSSIGFFTALLEPIIMKRRLIFLEVFFGLMGMFGIFLIFHFNQNFSIGIFLGLISSFFAVLFTISNKDLVKTVSPFDISLYEFTGGFFTLSCILPFYFYFFPSVSFILSLQDFGWLMILSLFCTVLAFNLSASALKKISSFTVNLTFTLEPIYGILLAFLIYKEYNEMHSGVYWGIAIIFTAVFLQNILVWKSKTPA